MVASSDLFDQSTIAALLDRSRPLYHANCTQRTCCERVNSQA